MCKDTDREDSWAHRAIRGDATQYDSHLTLDQLTKIGNYLGEAIVKKMRSNGDADDSGSTKDGFL